MEIQIYCNNTGIRRNYPLGVTLKEIAEDQDVQIDSDLLGAMVNNRCKSLDYPVVKPKTIAFFGYEHPEGRRMYAKSLSFLLWVAGLHCFPEHELSIRNSVSGGYFCKFTNPDTLPLNFLEILLSEMHRLVEENIPFHRYLYPIDECADILTKEGLMAKRRLFQEYGNLYAPLNEFNGHHNFFYNHLVPNSNNLKSFDLEPYADGFILRLPTKTNHGELEPIHNQQKLFQTIRYHRDWASTLNARNLSQLNDCKYREWDRDLIKIAEAFHEKEIARIADKIIQSRDEIKIVLIAGPSCSGKTTFSKRLSIQLSVLGCTPKQLSLDDYFVDRVDTPLDEDGNYDFEAFEAVDHTFLNSQLKALFEGDEVNRYRFDFTSGTRVKTDDLMHLGKQDILIIEGIHALNPKLINQVAPEHIYKIFISALTPISLDEHNYIPSTDNRLIRRIVRDSKFRNYSAAETIQRWPSVRKGEEKHIFPYQEEADVMFNSALIYELSVLKPYLVYRLRGVKEKAPEYAEAKRLLNFISYFRSFNATEIPPTSILREFLGGSSFEY
ncbi:nucleoside kinase [Halosquirtibacter xylanolyticus]|uniref:nucleoside kinase n=1 Tax=Halosquirtibacter xylanolyticus TaxID=3374599 RepID=UPI003748CE26|nr:nucleoside kinase [Prolixibacteraceae bacterium]